MRAYSYLQWSSICQPDGAGLRRRTSVAFTYAKKHGLELEEASLQPSSLPAFKGQNPLESKLRAFIKALDDGVLKAPCYLLIEELDRISRDDLLDALDLFAAIIRNNVRIVVLKTDQVFSKETMKGKSGIPLLLGALLSLIAANEESAKKSKRLLSAFERKRAGIKIGVIASRHCPSWLRVNEDKTKFVVDQRKKRVIRRIFDLAIAGNGVEKIAQILNEDDVELIGDRVKGGWKSGNVAGLLRQPALTGSFIHTATGEEINPHYYPEIIPKKDWAACQSSIKGRRNAGGYKQGTANLFSALTRCAYCGATFKFITNSNGGRKDGRKRSYLYCRNSQNHAGCDAKMMPYNVLESDVVMYLAEHIYDDLKASNLGATYLFRRKELQQEIAVKQNDVEKWVKAIERSKTRPDVLVDRLDDAQRELDELQAALAVLNTNPRTPNEVEDLGQMLMDMHDALWPIFGRHGHEPDDADFAPENQQEVRLKIQVALRRQIKTIQVAPFLNEHKRSWKDFKVKGPVMETLHMVKIIYIDGTEALTDVVTG